MKKEGKKEISLWKLSQDESILLIRLIIDITGNEKNVRNGDLGKILKIDKIFENKPPLLKKQRPLRKEGVCWWSHLSSQEGYSSFVNTDFLDFIRFGLRTF